VYPGDCSVRSPGQLPQKLADLIAFENSAAFDPARNDPDFTALEIVLRTR
jgi:hypothetical protein